MKSPRLLSACLFGTMVALILSTACLTAHLGAGQAATAPARAGSLESLYTRSEFTIPMRDGVRLDTVVFAPKDTSKTYPILLTRTPYGIPYIRDDFPLSIGPSDQFAKSGYIVAYQDVRGTHMSEGNFVNIRGTLGTFRTLGKNSPTTANYLVLGPWPHGGWADGLGRRFGGLDFASPTGTHYREQIEFPFFEHYLKDIGPAPAAKAQVFDTGSKEWLSLPAWPPTQLTTRSLYLSADNTLTAESPQSDAASAADSYISDPANPVPYSAHAKTQSDRYTPYMIEDQRFLNGRNDLLTYKTVPLINKVAVVGSINVEFYVQSPQATDADFIVKILDIYPSTYPADPRLANAEIQIRADVMRAKFRNSFEKPEPLVPGKATPLRFALPDICHTFLPGHRIAIQVQSSWFPIIDRNPQRFEDIYHADAKDFQKAQITLLRSKAYPSKIVFGVR